ncbi:putative RTA1 domain protein [Aspergillus lucknowensis]|uniref:RTA1 domain protein n=1 Tax=Aspergillus lucknowensis TaxID=176173 RepID=A0ABR4LSM6_9EURO
MANGEPVLWSLYVYAPNKGAPIFFAVAYAASAVAHIWQCYHYRALRLIGLYPICGVLFTLGYALRGYMASDYLYRPDNLIPFILSQVFIYIPPPLLELANYHILARIFSYVPYLAPLPPNRVLIIFGALMGLVELFNALGVALASNVSSSHSQQEIGGRLTIAALALQVAVILSFVFLAGIFHRRCSREYIKSKGVTVPLRTLYVSMFLILVRCVYRLVEHTGNTAIDLDDIEVLRALTPVLRYEWFLYVFEGALMWINMVLWNVWHPGRFLPRSYLVHLGRDGQEVEEVEEKDGQSLLEKILFVASFGILFRPRKRAQGFEEMEMTGSANAGGS